MRVKRTFTIMLAAVFIFGNVTMADASIIQPESIPENATETSVAIVEAMIQDVLTEVENGLGFGAAMPKANQKILKQIMEGKTDGYGYGILGPIAANSIRLYRDMYLRPDFYIETERKINPLISDLIEYVKNGGEYEIARKQAYIRILQNQDASFNPEDCYMTDFCYWDIPWVDTAYFTVARKLLLDAKIK